MQSIESRDCNLLEANRIENRSRNRIKSARRRHECEHTYRAEFSLANCDFSVWNGVPNVMTEQVGGGRRRECRSGLLSLSAVRPPNNSTSQLIARCFIASVSVRITAAGIFPCIAPDYRQLLIGTFSLGRSLPASSRCRRYPLGLSPSSSRRCGIRR